MHVVLVGPEIEENLSLRYLMAALRRAGHTASLARFDGRQDVAGVLQQVRRERPGLVGLSLVFQVRAREFYDLARALRAAGYQGHITAGGHFASLAHAPILNDLRELDTIVRHEGEGALVELADALQQGANASQLAAIPGLATRQADGSIPLAPPRPREENLDALPFPARDGSHWEDLGVRVASLVGSRGCYAECHYCSISTWHRQAPGRRFRMRSPANVADEMASLYHEHGVRFFVFHDDNFCLPTPERSRERFQALRREIEARGLEGIGLMLKLRASDCDRDNLLLLREMGLMRVFVGIENASARQLRTMGRTVPVEQVNRCLDLLRELGIYATYNVLLFDPYTTLGDVAVNLRFIRRHLHAPFNWCKVEPYAGTPLERRLAAEGRLEGDYLGGDYRMDDPRAQLMYDLLLPATYARNFDYYGLATLNIGLGYHLRLLRHFHPDCATPALETSTQRLITAINADALELLERAYAFVQGVPLADQEAIRRFADQLETDARRSAEDLSGQALGAQGEITRAAGLAPRRSEEHPKRPHFSAPFWRRRATRGAAAPRGARSTGLTRRGFLGAAWGGLLALAGCARKPYGRIRLAPGQARKVGHGGRFRLQASLYRGAGVVAVDPAVSCSSGSVQVEKIAPDKCLVEFDYSPNAAAAPKERRERVWVAWILGTGSAWLEARTEAVFVVGSDGTTAFRSTSSAISAARPVPYPEMAAPPIGPKPPKGPPTVPEMAAPPIRMPPGAKP